jgi:hypothetical protein
MTRMFWLPGASLLGEDACPRCVSGPVWVGYALGVLLILLLWNSARLVGLLNRSLRQSIFGRTPDQEAGDSRRTLWLGRASAAVVAVAMVASLATRVAS